jgi:hypothetical protein
MYRASNWETMVKLPMPPTLIYWVLQGLPYTWLINLIHLFYWQCIIFHWQTIAKSQIGVSQPTTFNNLVENMVCI